MRQSNDAKHYNGCKHNIARILDGRMETGKKVYNFATRETGALSLFHI